MRKIPTVFKRYPGHMKRVPSEAAYGTPVRVRRPLPPPGEVDPHPNLTLAAREAQGLCCANFEGLFCEMVSTHDRHVAGEYEWARTRTEVPDA